MAEASKKRKKVVLTIKDKLKVCELAKLGKSLSSIAAEFKIGKSTIYDIIKSESKLKIFLSELEDGDCIKKRKIMRLSDFDDLDKAVFLWFIQQRCKGKYILN